MTDFESGVGTPTAAVVAPLAAPDAADLARRCSVGRVTLPDDILRRVASHEAGHVVAGRARALPVDGVTVDPEVAGSGFAGRTWGPDSRDCKLLAEFSDVPLCELVQPSERTRT